VYIDTLDTHEVGTYLIRLYYKLFMHSESLSSAGTDGVIIILGIIMTYLLFDFIILNILNTRK